ncbi:MAG: short chain dehydrogenase [Thermoanaerobaculia bacterium]
MRILVIGATGTIGREVVRALSNDGDEVVEVSHSSTPITVDIADVASIRAMYEAVGPVDAVISAAGRTARRKPLSELTDDDFALSIRHKLMGQVNVIRYGFEHVRDGGSFTVTSGVLGREPMPGSETISLVNCALEGFVRAAALEAPRGIRLNVVSPPWITETLLALNMQNVPGLPASVVARTYVRAVREQVTGSVFEPEI